ncbi:hypothetical protein Mapa_012086 [Marchantia paleacea]|nr:hypothetical protein Mapa_012086 [Marchantia paleacea]
MLVSHTQTFELLQMSMSSWGSAGFLLVTSCKLNVRRHYRFKKITDNVQPTLGMESL